MTSLGPRRHRPEPPRPSQPASLRTRVYRYHPRRTDMTATLSSAPETFASRFHDAFGQPAEGPQKKVLPYLSEAHQVFIRQSPFLVMATANAAGQCDASPRG